MSEHYVYRVQRTPHGAVEVYRTALEADPGENNVRPYWSSGWAINNTGLVLCHRWDAMPEDIRLEVEHAQAEAEKRRAWENAQLWRPAATGSPLCAYTWVIILVVVGLVAGFVILTVGG